MKYNIWNKWDPLKVCMLGNNYAPEFFNGIPDKAGDPLKRICEETLEDLEGFKETLQQFGVKVIQPKLDNKERFLDNPKRYPRGPLQPRDTQLVLGNECYITGPDHSSIKKTLNEYSTVIDLRKSKTPIPMSKEQYSVIAGDDYPSYEQFIKNRTDKNYFKTFVWDELIKEYNNWIELSSATSFMLGTRLYVGGDREQLSYMPVFKKLHKEFEKFETIGVPLEGHTDGNFHPIKPGAILSLLDVQNYTETFPGWDVCYCVGESWHKVKGWLDLKNKNHGKWYLAGEEGNDVFIDFVETWLTKWVGYVEETVFDVNVLMIDEHHCCVSNQKNQKVNTFLKKHNVEPVYIPWRHRYFWDGGLHCITLDLYREGKQKDYFK